MRIFDKKSTSYCQLSTFTTYVILSTVNVYNVRHIVDCQRLQRTSYCQLSNAYNVRHIVNCQRLQRTPYCRLSMFTTYVILSTVNVYNVRHIVNCQRLQRTSYCRLSTFTTKNFIANLLILLAMLSRNNTKKWLSLEDIFTNTSLGQRMLNQINLNNLRYTYYLITPNETMFESVDEVPNYTLQKL
ncbi:unnamed protein product [Brugia pahangi]|uniref:FAS1 domain-containing protein n=1 Tax=Brugia pahangi TaxID=6280 RepID=A0A0N4T620_BRUPA|nr:unnamed protein product [Brugia pahangi]